MLFSLLRYSFPYNPSPSNEHRPYPSRLVHPASGAAEPLLLKSELSEDLVLPGPEALRQRTYKVCASYLTARTAERTRFHAQVMWRWVKLGGTRQFGYFTLSTRTDRTHAHNRGTPAPTRQHTYMHITCTMKTKHLCITPS